jgi:uncharacterized membrane protein
MKPFATLGSEIGKVRERVRRGAESLRPARVALDVKEQRDRLLAKLGEQTFRLIAERKLAVPKVLQDSVERLAALLGVQLPSWPGSESPSAPEAATPVAAPVTPVTPATLDVDAAPVDERIREAASAPLEPGIAAASAEPAAELAPAPAATEATTAAAAAEAPARPAKNSAKSPKAKSSGEKSSPKGKKRATRRRTK